jgi:hypothetical protein
MAWWLLVHIVPDRFLDSIHICMFIIYSLCDNGNLKEGLSDHDLGLKY